MKAKSLEGVNEGYRNYVEYPLDCIKIRETGQNQHAESFFIYRYIKGSTLEQNLRNKNLPQKLIILNQTMPQLLKGKLLI